MVLTIAAAIFVFGLLVLVHELGHFVTAKMTGMRVDEFAIGFGPKLVSFQHGETVYSIRAIPLGGFNDIAGMDPENNDAGSRGYCEKPVGSRMIVILAGSIMNFILPLILFFGIFFFAGVSTPNPEPILGTVLAGKPAAEAGLQNGDRVLAIDGQPISSWSEFVDGVKDNTGNPVDLTIQRGEATFDAEVTPTYDSSTKRAMVGVMGSVNTRYPGLVESASLAVQKTGAILYMMVDALYKIILELSGAELAGPIGVAQMAGEVAQMGFVPLLNFAAFLSLNLGIVNLFPIPALDGGHFLTLCVEAVRGKPLSPAALRYTQNVGIVLLLLLMILATKNDIVRVLFGG
ncbi:RIP metalloprotease RseP [Mitsuokella sp. WILCCON 0060]|uniref:RIP metalloprotease RseP n=1 Tax=Mitsuokella sp. WILCCON 0060 TaxID=3345341 RepID=UPI003F1CE8BD